MRWANLWAWLQREWLPFSQYSLALVTAGAAFWTERAPLWILPALLVLTASATIVQDRVQRGRSEIDAARQAKRHEEAMARHEENNRAFAAIHNEVRNRADIIARERDAIRASAAMLQRLVDDGVVDLDSLLRRFDTRSALLIYVYAASVGYKKDVPRRTYPALLEEELGCVRLPPRTSPAFLTTRTRLPPPLRDLDQLRAYIERRLSQVFAEEWRVFRHKIQAGEAQDKWYVDPQEEDWRTHMRATAIVSEIALGPSNLIRLNGGMRTTQVFEIIAEEVDLRRVSLSRERRRRVRDFMLRQTFDLMLEEQPPEVRDALRQARPALDAELGCSTIFDYLAVPIHRFGEAIDRRTGLSIGAELAHIVQSRLHAYEGALLKLGVTRLRG